MRVSAARDDAYQSDSFHIGHHACRIRRRDLCGALRRRSRVIARRRARLSRRQPRVRRRAAAPPGVPALPARPRPQPIAAADALPALSDLPPERRAIQVVGSGENQVDADAARARGLVIVDLSDAWAPSVLEGAGYRSVFTGLAADRSDGDGQPIAAGDRNYLELYGIPPALSVLRRRFLLDARGRVRARVRRGRAARGRSDPHVGRQHRAEGAGEAPRARATAAGGAARCGRRRPAGPRRGQRTHGPRRAGAPALRGGAPRLRGGGEASRLRGPDGRAQAQDRRVRHRDADRDARLPAEARGDRSGGHQAGDAGAARAAAAGQRLRHARARAHRTRDAGGRLHRGRQRRQLDLRSDVSDISRRRRCATSRPRPRDGVPRGDDERARHRDARGRGRVLPPPPARRLSLAEGRGPAAGAARVLQPRRWTCRSRSIAATSGTTSRSTRRACVSPSRASVSRSSPCS